jgi:hypothetical protein
MNRRVHSKRARGVLILVGLLALCFVSGCYERVSAGNQSLYRFDWWLGPAVIGAGILAVPIGWFVRKQNARWGFVLMVMGPVLLAIVAPAMYSDRVLIDDAHFEARYGFWFSPSEHNIRFDDLQAIRYIAIPARRGRTKYELRCARKSGGEATVHAGDLVRNAVPEILTRARAKGIIVLDQAQ